MIAIFSLLVTLVLLLLVTRIGAMALMLTGLSSESAKFQARSAYCGVGFTSEETELIMSHPVRRRIIYTLMLLGNIGLATVTASTIASILQANVAQDTRVLFGKMGILVAGLILLWLLSTSRWVERQHNRIISWALRNFTRLAVRDYIAILNLQDGYSVFEIGLTPRDWLTDRSLRELKLTREGILVLGIRRRDGTFLGTPHAESRTANGDTLVLYGPTERLAELDQRQAGKKGEKAHQEATREHLIEVEHQREVDPVEEGEVG